MEPGKAFKRLSREVRSNISLEIEWEAPSHLLPLLLVLNFLLSAIGATVGASLTAELVPAVPAHVNSDFLHCTQSLTSDWSELIYATFQLKQREIGSGTHFGVSFRKVLRLRFGV